MYHVKHAWFGVIRMQLYRGWALDRYILRLIRHVVAHPLSNYTINKPGAAVNIKYQCSAVNTLLDCQHSCEHRACRNTDCAGLQSLL